MRAYRDRRLAEFVAHCAATVPYYRKLFAAMGIAPSEIQSLEDLSRLPILTKDDVRAHALELVSEAVPARSTYIMHTSGTTGGGLRFPVTMRSTREVWATCWRYRGWHGIRMGTWQALFAGRSVVPIRQQRAPFWRVNYPGRQLLFSGYHVSPESVPSYVAELRKRRPPWLHGYPSLLTLIATHLVDSGSELGYPVRWVTTSSENLLPHQAATIQRAFGVEPLQHYGMAEAVANVSQCELRALHVDEDLAAVEFVPAGDDGTHRIIGTNLSNRAMPLLRYDVQDLATLRTDTSCSCGRPGRVVSRIDGRREDYVVLRNGARLGRLDHIFKDMVNVREAQIHQHVAGEMTIRVVRGADYGKGDEQGLLREAEKRVGSDMDVRLEYVESLPRSTNGKLRFVVSDLSEASIRR